MALVLLDFYALTPGAKAQKAVQCHLSRIFLRQIGGVVSNQRNNVANWKSANVNRGKKQGQRDREIGSMLRFYWIDGGP